MAVIRFDPEVPVYDRFARSYPQHAEGAPATYGPFSEACTTSFAWDAHFSAYACRGIQRRLGTSAALVFKPKMVLFVIDVDGPDHRWTPEWWAVEEQKVLALFKKHGRGYCYTTRGGYRIVFGLRDELVLATPPDALRWRFSYTDWLDTIEREFGIVGDRQCGDWTRQFRLPRVLRAEVDPPANEWHKTPGFAEIGEPDRMLAWREPYCAADDPRVLRSDIVIDVSEPAPVDDEHLIEAARALAEAWPTRNRHYAGLALCGALAKAGWSENAIVDFATAVFGTARSIGEPWYEEAQASARSSCEKVARGEPVAGWDTLVSYLATGLDGQPDESKRAWCEAQTLVARRAIGQGPATDLFEKVLKPPTVQELFAKALEEGDPAVANLPDDPRFRELLDEAATALGPAFEIAGKAKDRKRDVLEAKPMFTKLRKVFARDIPAPEFLVDFLIPKDGVGALSGEPKSGKSWDLMHICVCAAAQKSVFGRFAVQRPIGVAYFSIEDTEGAVKIRMQAIARALNLPLDGDWVDRVAIQARGRELDVCSLFDMCIFVASLWWDEEMTGCRNELVGMDPLSDIHAKKEDSRDDMAVVMAHFRAVQRVLSAHAGVPVTIMFVHHSGKESADNKGRRRGGQKMRGSSAIHGAIDFGLYVINPEGDKETEFIGTVESEVKAARGGGLFKRILKIHDNDRGNAERAVWTAGEVTKEEGPVDLADERATTVVQKLFDQGAPLTYDELKKKIGGKGTIISDAILIAKEEGWITQKFNGKHSAGYEITEKGRDLIRSGGGNGSGDGDAETPQTPSTPSGTVFLASYIST